MGCRTGFYLILEGELSSPEVLPLLREMLDWILAFKGAIPGAAAAECGNWQEQNLDMAQWEARRYAGIVQNPAQENLTYPA
jgi:S-ribosylhomocysteine lyase